MSRVSVAASSGFDDGTVVCLSEPEEPVHLYLHLCDGWEDRSVALGPHSFLSWNLWEREVFIQSLLVVLQEQRRQSCGSSAPSLPSSTRPSWKDRGQVCQCLIIILTFIYLFFIIFARMFNLSKGDKCHFNKLMFFKKKKKSAF